MQEFIPLWFYGFDSLIYLFATAIGFGISFQLLKLYGATEKKSHLRLHFGMILLSIGFLALSMVNIYSYINFEESCKSICNIGTFDETFGIYDLGYWVYYTFSVFAYILILTVYLPEKGQFPVIIPLPVWFVAFKSFHLTSLFLLSYIIFRTMFNYFSSRNVYRFLVMLSFLSLGGYHVLLFFAQLNNIIYVMAHVSLLISFLSLLFMLRVSRK
jgi:hypothetical protein